MAIKHALPLEGYNEIELPNGTFGVRDGYLVIYDNGRRGWLSNSDYLQAVEAEKPRKRSSRATATETDDDAS